MEQPVKPRLPDLVRNRCRVKHYSIRTEKRYLDWIRRFIRFHGMRHPNEMGAPEVEAFLTHLAVKGNVAPSTQNQALAAILFLYKEVLSIELPWLDGVTRARKSPRWRIKDVDFERCEITVREGKGGKDRRTMLPQTRVEPVQAQLERVRVFHEQDLRSDVGPVYPPHALDRKYPNAGWELGGSTCFRPPRRR